MIYILIIIVGIAFDQLTKWLVVTHLKSIHTLPLIKDVLHLTYAENTGAAFSILRGHQRLLIVVTGIAMIGLAVYLYKWSYQSGEVYQKIAFAYIIAGGLGNLIDRIRLGYVVDFIDFRLINFAIFNIADCYIVLGSIIFIGLMTFSSKGLNG